MANTLDEIGFKAEADLVDKLIQKQASSISGIVSLGYPEVIAKIIRNLFGKNSYIIAKWIKDYYSYYHGDFVNKLGGTLSGYFNIGTIKFYANMYDAANKGNEKYADFKSNGCTEGQSKAKALSDSEVVAIRRKIAEQDEVVGLITRHLRAWDKNHENAQSRGHFIRKEMDKLNKTIYAADANESTGTYESFMSNGGN